MHTKPSLSRCLFVPKYINLCGHNTNSWEQLRGMVLWNFRFEISAIQPTSPTWQGYNYIIISRIITTIIHIIAIFKFSSLAPQQHSWMINVKKKPKKKLNRSAENSIILHTYILLIYFFLNMGNKYGNLFFILWKGNSSISPFFLVLAISKTL